MDAANEGGSGNDLPWASVFNPAVNVHAFSAIQADGFRAASELVERFVRIASTELEKSRGAPAPATPASDGQGADLFGATGLEPLVTSWWAMADQSSSRLRPPRGRIRAGDARLRNFERQRRAPAGGRGARHGDNRTVGAQRRTDRPWQNTVALQRSAHARRAGDSGPMRCASSPTSSRCPHGAVEGSLSRSKWVRT